MNDKQQLILDVATQIAQRVGFRNVTRNAICVKAKVAAGTVTYYYPLGSKLQDAIMRNAVDKRIISIVAQGLVDGHKTAKTAPQDIKDAAAKLLAA